MLASRKYIDDVTAAPEFGVLTPREVLLSLYCFHIEFKAYRCSRRDRLTCVDHSVAYLGSNHPPVNSKPRIFTEAVKPEADSIWLLRCKSYPRLVRDVMRKAVILSLLIGVYIDDERIGRDCNGIIPYQLERDRCSTDAAARNGSEPREGDRVRLSTAGVASEQSLSEIFEGFSGVSGRLSSETT